MTDQSTMSDAAIRRTIRIFDKNLAKAMEYTFSASRQSEELVRAAHGDEFLQWRAVADHMGEASAALHRAVHAMSHPPSTDED